jgi:hypothetical protein
MAYFTKGMASEFEALALRKLTVGGQAFVSIRKGPCGKRLRGSSIV